MHHLAVLELLVVSMTPKPRLRITSSSACLYATISGAGTTARRPAVPAISRRGHAVVIARRSRRRRLRHLAHTSAEACHPGRGRRRHLGRCLGSGAPVLAISMLPSVTVASRRFPIEAAPASWRERVAAGLGGVVLQVA